MNPKEAPTASKTAFCCGVRTGSPPKSVRLTTGETSTKKEMAVNTTKRGPTTAENHMTSQSKTQRINLTIEGGGGLVGFVSIGLTLECRITAQSAQALTPSPHFTPLTLRRQAKSLPSESAWRADGQAGQGGLRC